MPDVETMNSEKAKAHETKRQRTETVGTRGVVASANYRSGERKRKG
jgi:hypothetical protein